MRMSLSQYKHGIFVRHYRQIIRQKEETSRHPGTCLVCFPTPTQIPVWGIPHPVSRDSMGGGGDATSIDIYTDPWLY